MLTLLLFSAEVVLVVFSGSLAALLLVAAVISVVVTSFKAFSEVVFSGAFLDEALVGVLAAAVSCLLVTLLGVFLPAAALLSSFGEAVLLGVDLAGEDLITGGLAGVVLLAEVSLMGAVLLAEVGFTGEVFGDVCVLVVFTGN